jgi:folate-binding protein YgfZ
MNQPPPLHDPHEYRAALETTALFDLSDRAKIELSGPDARLFLHNLCTNDVKNLPVGGTCEAFLTTAKARVVAHVWVSHVAQESGSVLRLDMAAGLAQKVLAHLDHYLISEQVELADRTEALAFFRLCGPHTGRLLESLAPDLGTCQIRRQSLLALDGVDVFCPASAAAAVRQRLQQAGAQPAHRQTYEVLRVEAGLPEYGPDIDEERLAMEVGRTAQAICYTKGCYLGQETIVMARDRGQVNRQLLGVKLSEGRDLPPSGTKLLQGSEEVGQITSAVFSPRLGQVAALAYLRRSGQTPGTPLLVADATAGRGAVVCSLPFVAGAARLAQ